MLLCASFVTARPAANDLQPYAQSDSVHRSASRFTASPTLKALAQQCVDSAEDETTFERFAAELSTSSLSPRVMMAYGHSGSSAAMMITHEMLEAHGVPAPKGLLPMELLKCEKIPGCTSNDARGVELALRRLVARWALEGRVLILKAHAAPLDGRTTDGSIWRSLHAMGARAVVAWRSNSLAYLISSARDCDKGDVGHVNSLLPGVATLTGPNAATCFERRQLPSSEQSRVRLSPEVLLPNLHSFQTQPRGLVEPLSNVSGAWAQNTATVTFERLLGAWQSDDVVAFTESEAEWTVLLRSLGVDEPDGAIVRRLLDQHRNSFSSSAVGDAIENLDEVAELLRGAGEPYASMLLGKAARDLDLLEPTYLIGYGSQEGGRPDAL